MGTHLRQTEARRIVLDSVARAPAELPLYQLREQLSAHSHAAERAVRALAAERKLTVHEVVAHSRSGRPRLGLALALAPADPRRPRGVVATLPRFSGAALRRARLRAHVRIATLGERLGVSESAVRWWEGAAVVPPARARAVLEALAELSRNGEQRPVSAATADRLRRARVTAGWSQSRLAAALGVSQSTVSNWEQGHGLSRRTARRIYVLLRQAPQPVQIEHPELRRLRARLGVSQRELARRIGVSVPTVRRWESGRTRVPPAHAEHLNSLGALDG